MCDFVEMKTISKIADGVLSKLTKEYSKDKKITPDVLTELRPVFGEIIFETFKLLERKGGITEIQSNTSKRTMFKVRGYGQNFDVNYIILPSSWRCSCKNWIYKTWMLNEFVACKHVLATKLCLAIMNASESRECPYIFREIVSENTYMKILAGMK